MVRYIREKGFDVCTFPVFVDQERNDNIRSVHGAIETWRQIADADETIRLINKSASDVNVIVVDHYDFDRIWEDRLSDAVNNIVVIDDLANREHTCDILLDQNLFEDPEGRYRSKVDPNSMLLLGPVYSLLRPQFAEWKKKIRPRDGKIKQVTVMFGGSDPANETARMLRVLAQSSLREKEILVIAGISNPAVFDESELKMRFRSIRVLKNIENMAEVLSATDFLIGAGGTSIWERCCLGIPSIVISVAENQTPSGQYAHKEKLLSFLGESQYLTESDIAESIVRISNDSHLLSMMSKRGYELVDGEGARRVAEKIASLTASRPMILQGRKNKTNKSIPQW